MALGIVAVIPSCTTPPPFEDEEEFVEFSVFSELAYTEMVPVEGGTFTMGATEGQERFHSSYGGLNYPTHEVTLSDYHIGKYEVTQQLWEYVMTYSGTCADGSAMNAYSGGTWLGSYNPSNYPKYGKGDSYPAYYVSYDDIVDIFLPRLNKITGKEYRLPTNAEWEFAARGGNMSQGYKYSGSNDADVVAWYFDNSGKTTHEVGTKMPNELGIYDMSGNVQEWCYDRFEEYNSLEQTNPTGPISGTELRVIRNGDFANRDDCLQVSVRFVGRPESRQLNLGFRLALGDAVIVPPSQPEDEFAEFPHFNELPYTEMVSVEGGTFIMGATAEQEPLTPSYVVNSKDDRLPTHEVTISDYQIGKYEVTQQLWRYVMLYSGTCADGSTMSAYRGGVWLGYNIPSSSFGKGNYYPAYFVSYNDIVDVFLPRLNKITGKTYRLPTEAEWEYAARGGNKSKGYKYSGSDDLNEVAWYDGNSGKTTHEVGTKKPNELGIYDMSGNVWEWCSDWYGKYSSSAQTNPTGPATGSDHLMRGGNWGCPESSCFVSHRKYKDPDYRYDGHGFRLVLP